MGMGLGGLGRLGKLGIPSPSEGVGDPAFVYDALSEDDMANTAFAAMLGALKSDRSALLSILGDSTGNETTDWPYVLADTKIKAAMPDVCIRYALWDNGAQGYGAWTTIQEGTLGQRHIVTDGSHMARILNGKILSSASGDLDVEFKVAMDDWTPSAQKRILGILGNAGNRAWYLTLNTNGTISLIWSADGTNLITVTSTAPTVTDGQAIWIRARLDVDNGGGGYTPTIDYSIDERATWTNIYSNVGNSGTTSIFASTNDLQAGAVSGSGGWTGKLYEVALRDGIGGSNRLPQSIEGWFDDTTTRLVYGGSPTLIILNGSYAGAGITATSGYLNNSTRFPKMLPSSPVHLVMLNTGHNETPERASANFYTVYEAWIDQVEARSPLAAIVALNQNPRNIANPTGDARADTHAQQMLALPLMLSKRGVECVNTYRAFMRAVASGSSLADLVSDGVHPDTPAGVAISVDEIWRLMQARLTY